MPLEESPIYQNLLFPNAVCTYLLCGVWFILPPPEIQRDKHSEKWACHTKHLDFQKEKQLTTTPQPRLIKFVHLAIGGIQLELDNGAASVLH